MGKKFKISANEAVDKKSAESINPRQSAIQTTGYKNTKLGRIPVEWEVMKLGDIVVESRLGGNYENSESHTGIPVIKMGNVGRGLFNIDKVQCLPETELHNNQDILKQNDLLFNTRNTLDLVGKVAIWRNELPLAVYNSNLMRIKFYSKFIHSNSFMNYVFNSNYGLNQLRSFATGTTSVAAIYGRDLWNFRVILPLLPEQQKIARILSTWDKAIEKTEQLIAQKQQLKKGLMQQLLTGKVRFKEFVKSKKMKKTKLGLISEAWEVKKIGSAVEIFVGRDLMESHFSIVENNTFKYPVYSNTVENHGLYGYYDCEEYNGESMTIVGRGAGLGTAFTRTGIYGAIGRLLVLFPKKGLSAHFLTEYVNSRVNIFQESSGIPQLTGEQVAKYEIVVPSLPEQRKVAQALLICDSEIKVLSKRLNKFKSQKKGLMQKLLTGQVRVSEL